MDQRRLGIITLIIGLLAIASLFVVKQKEDFYIKEVMLLNNQSCFLEDGTCLHADRDFTFYLVGAIVAASLLVLGAYLFFFDKSQKQLEKQTALVSEQNVAVAQALEAAKKQETEKDEFLAFLSGFTSDEQTILKAIKEQEGIQQSTLRFRTGLSKTQLSLMISELEKRGIVSKKEAGKTNELYLIRKF
ncbi:MAG: hypothetical protein Q7S65_02940 [Nanoarchaeota archaeon]|nr:hypothetical protein [Nanoarchaeota archaeon]